MRKNILFFTGSIAALSILAILPFKMGKVSNANEQKKNPLAVRKNLSPSQTFLSSNYAALSDKNTYAGLPVAEVDEYKTADAWGTVIYIPQTHRNPGSDPDDPSNDTAELAQQQMYRIISFLNEKQGINLLMAEGDLYGKVPEDKISYLSKKIRSRNRFVQEIEAIKIELKDQKASAEIQDQFAASAKKYIASLDREMILQGAPYKLKAEGSDMTLYGAENKATQDESTVIVRNYIYQQDKRDQLAGAGSPQVAQNKNTRDPGLSNAYALLMSLRGGSNNSIGSDLASLETLSKNSGTDKLTGLIQSGILTYQEIKNLKNENVVPESNVPSRQDNPYAGIKDPDKIKSLIKDSENKIQAVVIDRRNQETAANLASALKTNNKDIAMIQFGAGHEDGLVKELNKQGLNVVVVTPDEVINRTAEKKPADNENPTAIIDGSSVQALLRMLKK